MTGQPGLGSPHPSGKGLAPTLFAALQLTPSSQQPYSMTGESPARRPLSGGLPGPQERRPPLNSWCTCRRLQPGQVTWLEKRLPSRPAPGSSPRADLCWTSCPSLPEGACSRAACRGSQGPSCPPLLCLVWGQEGQVGLGGLSSLGLCCHKQPARSMTVHVVCTSASRSFRKFLEVETCIREDVNREILEAVAKLPLLAPVSAPAKHACELLPSPWSRGLGSRLWEAGTSWSRGLSDPRVRVPPCQPALLVSPSVAVSAFSLTALGSFFSSCRAASGNLR